jgi:hypothetical protein
MENMFEDIFTKEIIAKSRLELNNPDFDARVMNNIIRLENRRNLIRKIIIYPILVLAVEAIIFFIIQSLKISSSDLANVLNSIPGIILFYINIVAGWIIANGYFILPVIVILIIKKIIDSSRVYS